MLRSLLAGVRNYGKNFRSAGTVRAYTTSETAVSDESIEQIRARIFENRIGNGLPSGAKVLRKKLVGEKIASYYLKPIADYDPLYASLPAEAKMAKLAKLKRRGKGPPRKGQGKRKSAGKRR